MRKSELLAKGFINVTFDDSSHTKFAPGQEQAFWTAIDLDLEWAVATDVFGSLHRVRMTFVNTVTVVTPEAYAAWVEECSADEEYRRLTGDLEDDA